MRAVEPHVQFNVTSASATRTIDLSLYVSTNDKFAVFIVDDGDRVNAFHTDYTSITAGYVKISSQSFTIPVALNTNNEVKIFAESGGNPDTSANFWLVGFLGEDTSLSRDAMVRLTGTDEYNYDYLSTSCSAGETSSVPTGITASDTLVIGSSSIDGNRNFYASHSPTNCTTILDHRYYCTAIVPHRSYYTGSAITYYNYYSGSDPGFRRFALYNTLNGPLFTSKGTITSSTSWRTLNVTSDTDAGGVLIAITYSESTYDPTRTGKFGVRVPGGSNTQTYNQSYTYGFDHAMTWYWFAPVDSNGNIEYYLEHDWTNDPTMYILGEHNGTTFTPRPAIALNGDATVSATATHTIYKLYGQATLSGSSTLTATYPTIAHMVAAAALFARGGSKVFGSAPLGATGTLTASGKWIVPLIDAMVTADTTTILRECVVDEADMFKIQDISLGGLVTTIPISEGIDVTDTITYSTFVQLIEAITVNSDLTSNANYSIIAVNGIGLSDTLYVAFPVTILDDVGLNETTINVRQLSTILADNVELLSFIVPQQEHSYVVMDGATVADSLVRAVLELLQENISISLTTVDVLTCNVILQGMLNVTETAADSVSLFAVTPDYIEVTDIESYAGSILGAHLTDGMHFLVDIDGSDPISTWVMNPEIFAVSNYDLMWTGGLVPYQGSYLGADKNGLYLLGGTTDAGSDINAWVTTAALDFGDESLKQVPQVLLGSDGVHVVLKVALDGNDTAYYELMNSSTLDTKRVKIGKGLVGRTWQFTLMTKDNSDLHLSTMEFYPVTFKRRH